MIRFERTLRFKDIKTTKKLSLAEEEICKDCQLLREYLQCKFSFSSPSICLVCLDCTIKQRFDCSIVFISCIFSHLPGISLSPLFKLFLLLHICSYFLQISRSPAVAIFLIALLFLCSLETFSDIGLSCGQFGDH